MEIFRKRTCNSSETLRKLCVSTKFLHQEISRNFGILRCVLELIYQCDSNGTATYYCATDMPAVISELKIISSKFFYWFAYNPLKVNPGKYHLLLWSLISIMYLLVTLQLLQATLSYCWPIAQLWWICFLHLL